MEDLLTVKEVAERLRLGQQAIIRMCSRGVFGGAFQIESGRWRIPAASVSAYIAQQQAQTKSAAA
jgi:excisionase family DNA binding protein